MGNKLIDITGMTFGELTVLHKAHTRISPSGTYITRWACKCSCGKELDVDAYAIRSGNTKSCGCKNRKPIKDITGQRFGKLVVEEFDSLRKHTTYWRCKCDCGNTTIVAKANLLNGNTKSCGCMTSAGEAEIQKILENASVKFIHQKTFDSLRSKAGNLLAFDFALYEKESNRIACLIEYQGPQHYFETNAFGTYQRLYSDQMKRTWCSEHNILLHEIKYDEDIRKRLLEILSFHMLIPCQALEEEGVTTIP